jgi:hypothetical protein
MLTVTLRHRNGMPLRDLHGALMRAWRRCRQGGALYWKARKVGRARGRGRCDPQSPPSGLANRTPGHRAGPGVRVFRNPRRGVQSIWSEHVTASVRAVEMPHGVNGWHPHLHVLLRTELWDAEDRAILLTRWKDAIRRELGDQCTPNDEHALVWSDPIDASDARGRERYLTKLGLEVAGPGKKGKKGATHWELAVKATEGNQRALRLWEEFYRGTKGRRMLELDERAAEAGRAQLSAELPERDEPPDHTKQVSIEVKRDAVRALRRLERGHPSMFAMLLKLAETEGRGAVEEWVHYAETRLRAEESHQ